MTTYVGGAIDKEHIAERKTAEHLERLARQALRELSFSAVCTALDISTDRRKEILADYDWPLLRGLRICLLLGVLDPRELDRAFDAATDPDLMIRHLPTVMPPTPPTHTLPASTSPPFAAPPSPIPGGMVTSPPFAPSPTTATTTPPPPVVLSVPTPVPLYRTDADGLLSHILGYQMKYIEAVSFIPRDDSVSEPLMDGTILRAPTTPTHAYVKLTFGHGLTTMSHPYPNEDVSRLVLLLREFRARTGRGPTLRASS